MLRTFTFKGVLAALLLTCSFQAAFAQVFWTETFSDQASSTANWVHGGTNGGAETWVWADDPTLATFGTPAFAAPTATTGFFLFDSDANGEFDHAVTLTGPSIDCSSSTNTKITFWAQYAKFTAGAIAELNVSADGGATWTTHTLFPGFPTDQMYNDIVSVDIPEADGQSDVRLQFRWVGNYEYSWKVDDINLESVAGAVPCDQNPMAIICDNFDTYDTALKLGPQATWWTTWSGTEGTTEDGIVSTEQANTAPNSLKIISTAASGGPQDVVLDLGNKTTGRYELKYKIFVPAGKWGYYNMQNNVPIGSTPVWNFNVHFEGNNTGRFTDTGDALLSNFTYPNDQWFECKHVIDLDNNLHSFWVNGTFVKKVGYTGNMGGIDFFGVNNISTFYVDDVEYVGLPPVVYNVDECGGAVDLSLYFGLAPSVPQTTGIYDNTNATVGASDPTAPACWFDGVPNTVPTIDGSMWYTFTGDGGTYHIETVPCNSTDYIDDGDTQIALYTGECGNLVPVVGGCNEDLTGAVDYRAGLDIETVSGTNYYMLIDGWSDPATAFVATGEFCIEITQQASVTCAEGEVGTYTVSNNGFVCDLASTADVLTLNEPSFILPTVGPVYGISWAITTEPVTGGAWPPDLASYWGSFSTSPSLYLPTLANDGDPLTQNAIWYFTPVVVGGAIDTVPADPAWLHNLDLSSGCYFVGESTPLVLLAALNPLDATADVTQPTPGNNDGQIDLTVLGGIFDILQDPASSYTVEWSGPGTFTSNDEDISGLAAGDYTATITDITGCVDPFEFTVSVTTGVKDPASVKSLFVNPNPTSELTTLNLVLENTSDVRIEVLNTLGQTLQTVDAGKVNTLSQQIDLSRHTDGTYFLRVTVNGETAMRRVVLSR